MSEKVRILHIITGLQTGGAEMMLLKLLQEFPTDKFEHRVMSILGFGELTQSVRENCSGVIVLDVVKSLRHPLRFMRALVDARSYQADVIQGWMYHGNAIASIAKWFITPKSVVLWNLRCSEPAKAGLVTEAVRKLCVVLSSRPEHIIANSAAGMDYHLGIYYRPRSHSVIPNGVDISRFSPNASSRLQMRNSLSIPANAKVIGMAASHREMKDYPNFLSAVSLLADKHRRVYFLAAGRGVNANDLEMTVDTTELIQNGQLKLLDEVKDMPAFMNALDIFTLSSKTGEGFPNVIAEAMASGTPCVVTDAGDSIRVVDNFGIGVPTRSAEALADGWVTMLELGREQFRELQIGGRDHIVSHFQLSQITQQYVALYSSVLQGK